MRSFLHFTDRRSGLSIRQAEAVAGLIMDGTVDAVPTAKETGLIELADLDD
ncbi:MAG: hypothetical protein WA991_08525 [Ornithinimicrobium sp.]